MQRRLFLLLIPGACQAGSTVHKRRTRLRVPLWTDAAEPLERGEFTAGIDGKDARLVRVFGPDDDLLLLVVLDLSGDLTEAEAAREALAALFGTLPAHVWPGLLRAQDGLRVITDPAPANAAFIDAIRAQGPRGRAGMLETLETALRLGDSILARAATRVAVFYVTDSNIYNYREDFTNPVINSSDSRDLSRRFPEGLVREKIRKLEDTLASLETPLFFAHLDYRTDAVNEAYQTGLLQLAASTGGLGLFCRSSAEIPGVIHKALAAILSHWSLDVELPASARRDFQIHVGNGGHTLNYRSRFVTR